MNRDRDATDFVFDFVDAEPAPTNETCGTAAPITPGTPIVVDLAGVAADLSSACATPTDSTAARTSDRGIVGSVGRTSGAGKVGGATPATVACARAMAFLRLRGPPACR